MLKFHYRISRQREKKSMLHICHIQRSVYNTECDIGKNNSAQKFGKWK